MKEPQRWCERPAPRLIKLLGRMKNGLENSLSDLSLLDIIEGNIPYNRHADNYN